MTTARSEHLLLFRGTHWDKGLSPEEIQKVMTAWYAWLDRLTKEGKVKLAQPLANQGKIVSWNKGQTVSDGYFLLQVGPEEALEIAKQCPGLKYGVTVEVRPIVELCASTAT